MQPFQDEHSGSHRGARVAGTDDCCGSSRLDQIKSDSDGGILFFTNGVGCGIVHADNFTGMMDINVETAAIMFSELGTYPFTVSNQSDGNAEFPSGRNCPFHLNDGRIVPTHCINSNSHKTSGQLLNDETY